MKLAVKNLAFWSLMCLTPLSYAQKKTEQVSKTDAVREHRVGVASFYHPKFEGRKTANGEVFDNELYTCASNHYPLGTYLKVTNLANGKVVYVKVNDRMGHQSRVIDLTELAARNLNFIARGTTKVKLEKVSSEEGRNKIFAQNNPQNSNTKQGKNEL